MKRFLTSIALLGLLSGFFLLPQNVIAAYGDVSTFVGNVYDGDGGQANAALLDFPDDITNDGLGNFYIADTFDNAIRKVDSSGVISTLAGGSYGLTDGTGTAAEFVQPRGVAADASGNVYVADTGNDAIRKITPAGVVTTLVSSGLNDPYGVAVSGSTLFIADSGNNSLKAVGTSGGSVITITSSLNDPRKIDASSDGSLVYVADNGSHRVLRVVAGTGSISVLAGSGNNAYAEGVGAAASFENIYGIALTADDATLYVSDIDLYLTDRIRSIDVSTGSTSLFSFDATQQSMIFPAGMTISGSQLYVAMSGLGVVRRFARADASDTSIFAGTDRFGSREGASPLFGRPHDIALSGSGQTMYIADNNRVRKVAMTTKTSSYIIGSIVDNYREGLPVGSGSSNLDEARFSTISGIVVNDNETAIYVADRWNNRIRKIDLTTSPVSSVLVTGAGRKNATGETTNAYQEGTACTHTVDRNESLATQSGCAYFWQPTSLVLDPTETYLYVTDTANNRIRKVKISDGSTSLVAGSTSGYADGTGSAAKFNTPWGMTISDDGTTLYVADRDNHRIRKIDLTTNAVTSIAGSGSAGYREGIGAAAFFSSPRSIKLGADGNLYITEAGSHRVRLLNPTTGLTKLVAGSGNRGYVNGAAGLAEFNNLEGLAPETGQKKLYVVDSWNDVIREMDITGTAPYADPAPKVTKVVPMEVDRDWDKGTGLKVKIVGTGFRNGAVTKFYTYTATKTAVVSSTELTVTLPLSKMSAGWFDVTVTNVDGQSDVLEAGLALRGADDSVPQIFYSVKDATGITAFASTLTAGYYGATGNVTGDERKEIIAGAGKGLGPQVRIFTNTGVLKGSFFAYGKTTKTGVRVAACDLDGNGVDEIITVPGAGGRPQVRVFNVAGQQVITNGFYALNGTFTGGANLACGDTNGDGTAEIIVAASKGGGPQVTIHDKTGKKLGQFFAYAKSFRGGIMVGMIDLDGNGSKEIVTGPEVGAPHVQIFSGQGKRLSPGFYAFAKDFRGGISVAGGDTNDDGKDEIIVAPRSKAQARVKVYNTNGNIIYGNFLAYTPAFTGGVVVAAGDVNGDGIDDILTAPASGYKPSFRMFSQDGTPL